MRFQNKLLERARCSFVQSNLQYNTHMHHRHLSSNTLLLQRQTPPSPRPSPPPSLTSKTEPARVSVISRPRSKRLGDLIQRPTTKVALQEAPDLSKFSLMLQSEGFTPVQAEALLFLVSEAISERYE